MNGGNHRSEKFQIFQGSELKELRNDTDPLVYFLERKYSPGAAIEWYYQYQTLYLRLMAESHQMATENPASEDECSRKIEGTGNDDEDSARSEEVLENLPNAVSFIGKNATATSIRDSSSYSCPRCGNAYTRPHSLSRHIRFECGVEPQFECPVCHKKSKHKHNLVLHMRTHQKH
ncbi:uncharacterized protein LOC117604380 [Osmia lignaria lignaria]|uniref:uncharacterized protein LOC117604380 n=1 Tax=Osmia lignaria lignaria TaxID=1437193 RepID=UPI00402B305F